MSSQGPIQPSKGQPLTTLSDEITPASPQSSQRSSGNADQKLLPPQAGVSRVSLLNPRTWSRKARIITLAAFTLAIVALIPSPALAVPLTLDAHHTSSTQSSSSSSGGDQTNQTGTQPQQPQPQQPQQQQPQQPLPGNGSTIPLRIMPFGASITYGMLSTDGNGYRADLLDLLQRGGSQDVTYVGSRNNGTMPSNAVEGWPGDRIDQLLPRARDAVPRLLPNVVLINAGTNDCVQDFDVDSTTQQSPVEPALTGDAAYDIGSRMRVLVEDLLVWSPNATVVVSTLINNLIPETQARIDDANGQFREVVRDLQAQGRSVVLAEMTSDAGGPDTSMMADKTHPTDAGYALMANRWYAALVEASQKGLIVPPQ